MDNRIFSNYKEVNPGRFAPNQKALIPTMYHLPFSFGKRKCIAQNLAEASIKIIVVLFVKLFKFQSIETMQ
jgi:cytochrome P450